MLRYESILRRVDGIGVAGFATKEQGNCRVRRVKRRMQSYRGIKYLQATRERERRREEEVMRLKPALRVHSPGKMKYKCRNEIYMLFFYCETKIETISKKKL